MDPETSHARLIWPLTAWAAALGLFGAGCCFQPVPPKEPTTAGGTSGNSTSRAGTSSGGSTIGNSRGSNTGTEGSGSTGGGRACAPQSMACADDGGSVLVDTLSDPRNCGGCGRACGPGLGCGGGLCGSCRGYRVGQETDWLLTLPGNDLGDAGLGIETLVLGDFTGDGRPDLVVEAVVGTSSPGGTSNQGYNSGWLFANDRAGGFGTAAEAIAALGAPPLRTADLNGDCRLDLVDPSEVCLNEGDGGFLDRSLSDPSDPWSYFNGGLDVADFNRDGRPDLVVTGTLPSVLLGDGSGGFHAESPFAPPSSPGDWLYASVTADFQGEGTPAVVGVANWPDAGTFNFYSDSAEGELVFSSAFAPSPETSCPGCPSGYAPMAAGDLAGVGHAALAYSSSPWGSASVVIVPDPANVKGWLTLAIDGGVSLTTLAVADLDLDGQKDVLAGGLFGDGGRIDIWTGFATDGGQLLTPEVRTIFTQVPVTFLAVGDLNGDGIPDIVAAGPGFGLAPPNASAAPMELAVFLGSCP